MENQVIPTKKLSRKQRELLQKQAYEASPYIIEIEHLKIVFEEYTENETLVLQDFSYKFKKNKIYFIIGNSGAGKTTLVTTFNGLLKSKYGKIRVGTNIIDSKKRKIKNFKQLRKTVGMVFQFPEYQLFKDTVQKDIMFGPVNLGVDKKHAQQLASKYLNEMGLDDSFLQRSPFGLSGGQKRRVAIAGILAIEPDVLVFDEPTAGLDPAGEIEMINIIKNLKKQGRTIFVITHVMDQVLEIGDEVLVLGDHKILKSGTPYEIFTDKDLLNSTSLNLPQVIEVIQQLVNKDKRYQKLYEYEPRNVNELAIAIKKINAEINQEGGK